MSLKLARQNYGRKFIEQIQQHRIVSLRQRVDDGEEEVSDHQQHELFKDPTAN